MNTFATSASEDKLRARIAQLEEEVTAAGRVREAHEGAAAHLRENLEYTKSIVDTVREPLLVLDSNLRVLHASRSFYRVFGAQPSETVGRFLYDLGNGQWDVPGLRTLLEEVLPRDRKVNDFEVTHDFPALGRRVMLLNARKLWRDDNHTGRVLLAIEDVTERRRIELELLQSNEDLQRFAYAAAHDLRSPLNAALRTTQLLARHLKDKIGEEDRWMLRESIQSMERLAILMEDILTYSESANTPRQPRAVRLKEALEVALQNLQHHISDCDPAIRVAELPTVLADRTQMVMVFQNLLSNALKYRREEPLRISVDAVREGDNWRICVSDNGQGFEPQYAATIFIPFKRLHGPSVPGSGIGLATCKRIIEQLGGRLWAESTLGQGSRFYFSIAGAPAEIANQKEAMGSGDPAEA